MTPPVDLNRARSVRELLDASLSLWWRNRAVFFTLSLIIVAPVAIIATGVLRNFRGLSGDAHVTLSDVSPLFLLVVLTLVQVPLITASFARAVERLGAGEAISVGDALRAGGAVFGSALAAIILAGLLTMLASLALILPGFYLAVRLAFAGQAAAIERAGIRNALRTSMQLTQGRFWNLLGILALVTFGGFVAATAVQAPFAAMGGTAALAATAIVQSAVTSVTALVLTLVYFDLKVRHAAMPAAPVEPRPAPEAL